MKAPDLLEWVLLVAALFGVWHHTRNLRFLCRRCRGALPWSEVLICRIYFRNERVRIVVKVALVGIAGWLISQPIPVLPGDWHEAGVLSLRVSLIGVALALDWESIKANRDRNAIARQARSERRAAIMRRGRTGDD